MKTTDLILLALVPLAACLDDKKPQIDCGQGDAVAYAGAAYCVYPAAIIIEGFDCPPDAPYGTEFGDAFICAPTSNPPEGGWQGVIDAWKPDGDRDVSMPDSRETFVPADVATESTEAGPDSVEPDVAAEVTEVIEVVTPPSVCLDGLTPGGCWDDTQCPEGWTCQGAVVSCTPCVDCAVPIPGYPGTCSPAAGDGLGLMLWPGATRAEDVVYALFAIASPVYTLLECPAFALEQADGQGGWGPGTDEVDCSGAVTPSSAAPTVRRAPELSVRTNQPVRARGRYRSDCFSADPANCSGTIELLSNEITLPE